MLVALAVHRAGREQLGIEWPPEQERALRDANAHLRGLKPDDPTLDLGKLAGGLLVLTSAAVGAVVAGPAGAVIATATVGAGLKELAATLAWKLPMATSQAHRRDDQEAPVIALVKATNALIGEVQGRHKPVLLVVDGLDRVSDQAAVHGLFIGSALLGRLQATTILTGPLSLLHDGMIRNVRDFDARPLDNLPVVDMVDPSRPGPGVKFFIELTRLRAAQHVLSEAAVRRLAWASGGIIRDFLKLVQGSLAAMYDRGLESVDDEAVASALDEERRKIEWGLSHEDLDLLAGVAADPNHELPSHPRVPHLLTTLCLLPYPNGSQWWYPHPLLTLELLRRRSGSNA